MADLEEQPKPDLSHVAGSLRRIEPGASREELTKPGHSQTDAAPPPLARYKNLFERGLDGLWRDAEGGKPRHFRRSDSVGLHEFHLRAA